VLVCRVPDPAAAIAQVVVGSRAQTGGRGTALDLLLRRISDGALVAGEVKFGFGSYWDRPIGRLRAPLAHVPSSPLHHAVLQVLMGAELARQTTYPAVSPGHSVVVRALGASAEVYPVARFAWWPSALKAIRELIREE
jgi:hypothetical protein